MIYESKLLAIVIAAAYSAALLQSSEAQAKSRFTPYEARNSIVEGKGGTRTTKHGIDYWTMGDPPRRYQVIGIIRDKRGDGPLSGDAIGSKSVAKATLKAGGDAVIYLSSNSRVTGVVSGGQASAYGNQTYGSGWSRAVSKQYTQFAVIKYLD